MSEIKEIFGAAFYDPDVLSYFEREQPLEGRWGWLEVLRKAEDNDRLVVFDRISLGCCEYYPELYGGMKGCLWGPEYIRQDTGGIFQKTGWELSIGGTPHMQVALEGHRYQIQKSTHCVPHLRYGEICDPLIQHWEWKADVVAMRQYMGLRRDPARTDWFRLGASVAALATPKLVEEWGELVSLGIEVVEATSREDMVGAFQEVTVFLVQEVGGRVHPYIVIGAEIIDLGDDAADIVESLGYRWVP